MKKRGGTIRAFYPAVKSYDFWRAGEGLGCAQGRSAAPRLGVRRRRINPDFWLRTLLATPRELLAGSLAEGPDRSSKRGLRFFWFRGGLRLAAFGCVWLREEQKRTLEGDVRGGGLGVPCCCV